jgi:hypothetical protein
VQDRERFAKGTDALIEALLDIFKATGKSGVPTPVQEFRSIDGRLSSKTHPDGSVEYRVLVPPSVPAPPVPAPVPALPAPQVK